MDEPEMTNIVQPASRNGLRWLHWGLAASVAINLAVAGLVVGAIWRGQDGQRRDFVRDLGFGVYSEALSPEDRKALRQSFREKMPEFRKARVEMGQDLQGILSALRANPFDAEALKARLLTKNQRSAGQLALGQELIRDLMLGMSPEARLAFADRLEGRLRHGKDRSGDKAAD